MEKIQQCYRFVREGRWMMKGVVIWTQETQVGLVETSEGERWSVSMLTYVDILHMRCHTEVNSRLDIAAYRLLGRRI